MGISIEEFRKMQGTKPEQRKTKMGNTPTVYNGRTYHSKAEAEYAQQLDLDPSVLECTPQVTMRLVVNGELVTTYRIDFVVRYRDRVEYVEVKGHQTDHWRIKWALTKALHKCGQIEGVPPAAIFRLVQREGRKLVTTETIKPV